ncbi:MAG: IS3 family transposase [Gemmatimonas sp.]|jgi:putative transposase|uniref:IS3 family transposase n=1 Tax=Gemmatimonas sp. TaxID=1962908 RepID=UPI0031C715F9|nr:IS3 family transposase [Gemmatimonas sp.]MCO4099158.1 IS3 family transposase [Gemmatimonas sp.]
MTGRWVPPDRRDEVVDWVTALATRTALPVRPMLRRLGIARTKYARWTASYGALATAHGPVPREHHLTQAERDGILAFHDRHPRDGYRQLADMLLDAGEVAVSPSSVYRVLKVAGRLDRWTRTPSKKGTGFDQPTQAHAHWHIDFTYVNIAGTFYYLCAILDGWSRYLVHWELRESMTTADVTTILQRARERFPDARPRMISDNGPQFVARDFRDFIRVSGMTHVRTAPYYPQSNGKLERWHQTLNVTTIRPEAPHSIEDARRLVTAFVAEYNTQRLHSAIGYLTPADRLAGRSAQIWATRDQQLEAARAARQLAHRAAAA